MLPALALFLLLDADWLVQVAERIIHPQGAARQISAHCLWHLRSWTGTDARPPSVVWTDSRFIPVWIPWAALLGLLAATKRTGPSGLAFWVVLSATSLATGACFAQHLNTARLQTHSLPWLVILAAEGLVASARFAQRTARALAIRLFCFFSARRRPQNAPSGVLPPWLAAGHGRILIAAAAALAATALWTGKKRISGGPICTAQWEYRFVSSVVSDLPKGCLILLPDRQGIHNTYQPFFVRDQSGKRPIWFATNDPATADREIRRNLTRGPHACLLFYRPAACFAAGNSPTAPRSACPIERDLRSHWRLVPLALTTLPAAPCWAERFAGSHLPVGFFAIQPPADPSGLKKRARHADPPNGESL